MTSTEQSGTVLSRRQVLLAAGAAGAVGALAACGSSDSGGSASSASAASSATSAEPSATVPPGGGGAVLGPTADIPVGGGVIYDGPKVVVTQPAAGQFEGFTAVCPHQGCLVSEVADNEIRCACHGSAFSAEDGSVIRGPATQGLAAAAVSVEGTDVVLA